MILPESFPVSLVQADLVWEDPMANQRRIEGLLDAAAPAPGGLIVLPELCLTGFSTDPVRAQEWAAGAQADWVADLARRWASTVVAGVVTRDAAGQPANTAVACGPGGESLAWFAKLHPFSLAGESLAYAPGRSVVTFPWGSFRVAPLICYDLRFPESFRAATRQGAEVLLVLANWPARRERHWLALLTARAIENQAYVVGVNRVGKDPHATYSGRSVVVDPMGVIVADAGEQERVLTVSLESGLVSDWRRDFPALRDRVD
jgi:omega-amidase